MNEVRTPVTATSADPAVRFHDALAASWEGKYQKESFGRRTEILAEMLEGIELAGASWLDAGCGTGTLSRWLAQRGCKVLAVDASVEMVHAAQAIAASTGSVEYQVVGSIAELAIGDSTLDGILCSSVLEYVPDPRACLLEFRRVLKPGGVLLVSVPNSRSAVRKLLQTAHWASKVVGRPFMPYLDYSRHEYSASSFATMLKELSFGNLRSVTYGAGLPAVLSRASWAAPLLMYRAHRME